MKKIRTLFTVFEFDKVFVGSTNDPKRKTITKNTFDEILALSSLSKDINGDDVESFIEIGSSHGTQFIKFNNYVGSIALPNGVSFEVLPKVSSGGNDFDYARKLIIKMLELSSYIKFKTKQEGLVDVEKLPIFEFYIYLFISEVDTLIKKGLKSSYVEVEENSYSLKGRIIFNKQIAYNNSHRERFYVEHDVYDINRPENKIIKSTLLLLNNVSRNNENLRNIRRLLLNMDSVDGSTNIKEDLSKCLLDRNVIEYKEAIKYARVFLLGYSFSVYSGSESNVSLLFPTELLYQEYVYQHLSRYLSPQGYKVIRQDTSLYLFTNPQKFMLKPDIVIVDANKNRVIVDTKWKIIEREGDISQADMYQMFAYHKRFTNVKKVVLLYPSVFTDRLFIFKSGEDVTIEARFVKLLIEDNKADFLNLVKEMMN